MSIYLGNITAAVILFPFLALVLTVPYALYQYRRYGAISFWKTLVVFSFLFYFLCAYFMVILPLPECRVAAECGAVSKVPGLTPFTFIPEFIDAAKSVGLSLDPHSWLDWVKSPAVYTTLFNVLLTFPLGAYARYIFKMNWWKSIILGFCVSLFFEFSQLTGLWGFYDYAYRIFDVDDLIINTTGCLLGNLLAIPLIKAVPPFENLGNGALVKGSMRVSPVRRLVGYLMDFTVCIAVSLLVTFCTPVPDSHLAVALVDYVITGFFFMVVPALTKGQTIGQKMVRLRMVRADGSAASLKDYVVRYGLFQWGLLMGPYLLLCLMPQTLDDVSSSTILALFAIGYGVWFLTILIRMIGSVFGLSFVLVSDIISGTALVPVLSRKQQALIHDGARLN